MGAGAATNRGVRRGSLIAGVATAALLVAALAPAAESLEFGTDRDAFTPSTHAVDPGVVLAEWSYVYIDNLTGPPTNNYPELLVRGGLNDWLEWRFGVNYGVGSQGNVVTSVEAGESPLDGSTLHESSLLYGFKADVAAQQGLLPETCFIIEGATPTYGPHEGTIPVATIVSGWELPVAFPTRHRLPWRLDGAVRYAYSEGNLAWFSRWSPSTVLRMPVTERFEVHAEWFGSFTQGLSDDLHQPFFSPGFHHVFNEHFEIGLRVGWGLSYESAPFFADTGMAWRW